jgi:hypothetical protein
MSTPCLRILATFSKCCPNTKNSANIKVVQILVGHISSLGWHFKFWEEKVQICKSNLLSLFLSAMKIREFTSNSGFNQGSKHMSTFIKIVGGCLLYNFCIWRFWSSFWKFWIWSTKTRVVWNEAGHVALWLVRAPARRVAHQRPGPPSRRRSVARPRPAWHHAPAPWATWGRVPPRVRARPRRGRSLRLPARCWRWISVNLATSLPLMLALIYYSNH